MKTLLALAGLAVMAAGAGAIFLYGGFYNIAAVDQHLRPTFWLLQTGMEYSVRRRIRDLEVPPLDDPALKSRGLAAYRAHCVRCHGAPGVAPEAFALGLTPSPSALAHTAKELTPAELFWVIKYGIKMTGMPAWEFRMADAEMWAIVAFMRELPRLTPAAYAALEAPEHERTAADADADADGTLAPNRDRALRAFQQYACVTCHVIPGVVGPDAPVGPPLARMGARAFIAGVLPNDRDNMIRWLRDPQAIAPKTAMPDLGVTARDAREMAEYLAGLK